MQQEPGKATGRAPEPAVAKEPGAADAPAAPGADPMDTDDDLLCDRLGEFAELFTTPCSDEQMQRDLIKRAEPYLESLAPVFKRRKQL